VSTVAALSGVFGISFLVALSGALAPGPLLTYTVSGSLRKGFVHGPLVILGHAAVELTLVVLLSLGLSAFFRSKVTRTAIGLVGGVALVTMGAAMLLGLKGTGTRTGMPDSVEISSRSLWRSFAGGALVSLANPYFLIWWATIGLSILLGASKLGLGGIAAFCVGHVFGDAAWYLLVAAGVCTGRKWFQGTGYAVLVGCCAAALVGFGGWFLSHTVIDIVMNRVA